MKSAFEIVKSVSSYSDKLETQNWHSFARKIRQENGNFYNACRRGDLVLQVHHTFYDKKRQPWEYESHEMVVLCEKCHHELHDQLQAFRKFVFGNLTPASFKVLNGALLAGITHHDPLTFVHAIAELAATPRMVERFAAAWAKEPNDL